MSGGWEQENAEKGGWGVLLAAPVFAPGHPNLQSCRPRVPLPCLNWVQSAGQEAGRGKKSEIREGLSREAAAASPAPQSSGELRQEGGIQEGSRGGGRQLGGLHLLLKEPRSQAERRKDLAFTSTGLLSSFEHAFRKEKARLKGSTKESQRHA